MSDKQIITISREFGSGGRSIGRKLAERLGIDYYDRDMLGLMMDDSYSEEEEKIRLRKSRDSIVQNIYASLGFASPAEEKFFKEQAELMKQVADEKSCVIVGRCADYVLDGRDDVIKIFFYSSIEERVRRTMEKHNISESEARIWVATTDATRRGFYNRQTGRLWGDAINYDLTMDTEGFSVDDVVDIVISYIDIKNRTKNMD